MSGLHLDGSRAIDGLAWAHLHFLWQGTIVALVLALLLALVPARMARFRYALGCLALLAAAALPVWTAFGHVRKAVPRGSPGPIEEVGRQAVALADARVSLPEASETSAAVGGWAPWLDSARPWIVMVWLLGVGWLSVRNLRGWRRAREMEQIGTREADSTWQRTLADLCRRMGVEHRVRLLCSTLIDAPVAIGWLRPVVLLPVSALSGLTPAQIEAVLAHELAHIRRHDYLINLIQIGVETLLFYHPGIWWISSQIRIAREHCCDDVAVSVCDRATYAFALTALEEGREDFPALALQATGGGLLGRIQRVLRREEHCRPSRNQHLLGVGTMIAITIALTGFACFSSVPSPAMLRSKVQESGSQRTPATSFSASQEQSGLWIARLDADRLRLELRPSERRDDTWGTSFQLPSTQVQGLSFGDPVTFRLVRDAGTFTFTGDMVGDEQKADGAGRYVFQADPSYVEHMAALGYRDISAQDLFRLATLDVSRAFVGGLRELGYDVPLDTLIKMAIHEVTPEYIRELVGMGYRGLEPTDLIKMRIHDVTPEYAQGMARITGALVPPKSLVELSIHDVTPAFAEEVRQAGYEELDLRLLRDLKIHDVDAAFIRNVGILLQQRVPLPDLIKLRIHDVTDQFIGDMITRFGQLDAGQLVKMSIHDVTVSFVDEMGQLGYGSLSVDQAVKMQIHEVNPEYVRRLQAKGITGLTVEQMVKRKIHGEDD